MCNCNQKRASLSTEVRQRGTVNVKLIGDDSVQINGDVTGRGYRFSKQQRIIAMDSRDAQYIQEYQQLVVIP